MNVVEDFSASIFRVVETANMHGGVVQWVVEVDGSRRERKAVTNYLNFHSLHRLSWDRSTATYKASSP
jgi:hypothetical protein